MEGYGTTLPEPKSKLSPLINYGLKSVKSNSLSVSTLLRILDNLRQLSEWKMFVKLIDFLCSFDTMICYYLKWIPMISLVIYFTS